MKNRIIYESSSPNNVYIKNNNSEMHMRKILEIRNRENKFLFKLNNNSFSNNVGNFLNYNANNKIKRANSPQFKPDYIDRVSRENDLLYSKIKKLYHNRPRVGFYINTRVLHKMRIKILLYN